MLFNAHVHMSQFGRDFSPELAEVHLAQFRGQSSWMTGEPWTPDGWCVSGEMLIRHMDEAGVDRALIMCLAYVPVDSYDPTMGDYIADLCRQQPDRLIGFYSADPIGGTREAARLRRAVQELGLRGLKMLPSYNYVPINDRRIWPLYETAAELGVPMTIHTGWSSLPLGRSLAYDHPLYIEDALVDFPGLRPILAHCGFAWSELVLMLMAKDTRVAADFAWWSPSQPPWRAAQTLSMAKYLGVFDRLFWGTDYPFTDFKSDLSYWRSIPAVCERLGLAPVVTDADIEAFLGPNFAAFVEANAPEPPESR
jgi:predicted TIM-barrel fold metal-dependent hydrolase